MITGLVPTEPRPLAPPELVAAFLGRPRAYHP
jgi:hypothetical protein